MKRAILVNFLIMPCVVAQAQAGAHEAKVRKFVTDFYHWYLYATNVERSDWEIVYRERASCLDKPLLAALQEEDDVAMPFHGEYRGIRFDPFTHSDDPGLKFVIKEIKEMDHEFQVKIYFPNLIRKTPGAEIIAKIARSDGNLVFTNFFYSDNSNLMAELKKIIDKYPHDSH